MKSLILLSILLALPTVAFSQPTYKLTPQLIYGLDGKVITDQPVFTAAIYDDNLHIVMERIRGERIDMTWYNEMIEANRDGVTLFANPHLDTHIVTSCPMSVRTVDDCIEIHLYQRDRKLHLLLYPDEELYSRRDMAFNEMESSLGDLSLSLDEYLARWEAGMIALWKQFDVPELPAL